ncbi:MAG: response regulator transcription factor [Pyrinomonadaceae bacterium]|nr:response regulator transcription factor [Pyrinomonadaceae bacterium]
MKVLIVEDEQHLAEGLRFNLEAEGFEVEVAATGEEGLKAAEAGGIGVVVLDVMLPGINGFDVARRLRDAGNYVPILMLNARGRPEDVLEGFDAGADDYLPKPFELRIFLARLNGLLRRSEWSRTADKERVSDTVEVNGRTIDFANLELRQDDTVLPLTLMEIKLLRYLIEHEGTAVSRRTILEDVWGLQEDTDTRAIDNFIVRLRKYLEDEPNDPKIVRTVRGVGYKFTTD